MIRALVVIIFIHAVQARPLAPSDDVIQANIASFASVSRILLGPSRTLAARIAPMTMKVQYPIWWVAEGGKVPPNYTHISQRQRVNDISRRLYYSQGSKGSKEDRYAFNTFFWGVPQGFFLEMGAINGVTLSNTKFFADTMGWRGVLIEPWMQAYNELVSNRPESICINAAICEHLRQVQYVEHGAVSGIWEFMSEDFKKIHHRNPKPERFTNITCIPLGTLVKVLQVSKVNFFSLDVEGGELAVLRTLNFKEFRADVIVVEADNQSKDKNEAVRSLLIANDYIFHGHVGMNDWFVHSEFEPIANPNFNAESYDDMS